jgi:hypothetical protein
MWAKMGQDSVLKCFRCYTSYNKLYMCVNWTVNAYQCASRFWVCQSLWTCLMDPYGFLFGLVRC